MPSSDREKKPTEIEELIAVDDENTRAALKLLREFSNDIFETIEIGAQLFKTISRAFSQDESDHAFDLAAERIGASSPEAAIEVIEQELLNPSSEDQCLKNAASELGKYYSREARCVLLLLSWKYYMFAWSDILKLRLTPSMGHYRLQIEAAALMDLIRNRPIIGREWYFIKSDEDGRRFFRKYNKEMMDIVRRSGLLHAYNHASGRAQHVRLASGVLGMRKTEERRDGKIIYDMRILFQEIKEDDPSDFLAHALFLLKIQHDLFRLVLSGSPEISDRLLIETRIPQFHLRIEKHWADLFEAFPEKIEKAKKAFMGQAITLGEKLK